ncbi:MFS transporter [Aquipseudomonas campi]
MTRAEVRRRLALEWWRYLALSLAPLFVLSLVFGSQAKVFPVLEVPFFIAGIASMFVTLPIFSAYKRALIGMPKVLGTPEEPAAWIELARRRRVGFLAAGLPAWIAAVALFSGLNAVALFLLALTSVIILCLYRVPPFAD